MLQFKHGIGGGGAGDIKDDSGNLIQDDVGHYIVDP